MRRTAFFTDPVERSNKQCRWFLRGITSRILPSMLPFKDVGRGAPALVLMPFLGGSQREWTETVALLDKQYRCITLDLPGFGAASNVSGYRVSEMCDALIERLTSLQLERYVLVGHSMAGKVSAVTARRLQATDSDLSPPEALVLVTPSPPSPEPMSDEKRSEMLAALGNAAQRQQGSYSHADRQAAEKYINDNRAQQIAQAAFERTVDDVLAMNPEAWIAWLTGGSKEDWGEFVGLLDLPTLIVAGTNDKALGPDAQRTHTLPHFSHASLREVDSSHLVPLECPDALATSIGQFVAGLGAGASSSAYLSLIKSARVSPQTRTALLERLASEGPQYKPQALGQEDFSTLRQVMERIIPQEASGGIDLATRLDKELAQGKGDGWRYAALPSDAEACRTGLSLLDEFAMKLSAVPFARLLPDAQDSLLTAIAAGRLYSAKLDLRLWFEDLRAHAVQLYVSHPNTLARMGYSGIADDPNGFVQIGIGAREAWEPETR